MLFHTLTRAHSDEGAERIAVLGGPGTPSPRFRVVSSGEEGEGNEQGEVLNERKC